MVEIPIVSLIVLIVPHKQLQQSILVQNVREADVVLDGKVEVFGVLPAVGNHEVSLVINFDHDCQDVRITLLVPVTSIVLVQASTMVVANLELVSFMEQHVLPIVGVEMEIGSLEAIVTATVLDILVGIQEVEDDVLLIKVH